MKIRPNINEEKIDELVRYNPNTKGTHIMIFDGESKQIKRDYSDLVLLSLMYKKGFLKPTIEETIRDSNDFVESYEDNVMGL
jgi:hypothetical protein